MIAPGNHWIYDSLRGAPPREKRFGATLWNAGDGVPYGEILPKRVGNGYDRSAVCTGTTSAPPAKRDQVTKTTVIARPDRAVAISSTTFRH